LRNAVLTIVCNVAARLPASRLPMNSQFFRPTAICFINCSASLLSIGGRRNGGGHDGDVGAREADPGAVGQIDLDRRGGPR
jgi:hypothetical protein